MEWLRNLVSFRNGNHLTYFLLTFPLTILMVVSFVLSEAKGVYTYIMPFSVLIYLAIMAKAIYIVLIKKVESEVFSFDCIWYNGFLAAVFATIFIVSLYYK